MFANRELDTSATNSLKCHPLWVKDRFRLFTKRVPDDKFFVDYSNVVKIPSSGYVPDRRGVGCVFFDSMTKNADKVAQVDGITGTEDLYKDLLQRSVRVAIALRKRGVEYGDVVSICSFNHLDSCTPVLAALFLGAPLSGIDECISSEDAAHLLTQVQPKVIFVVQETLPMIENALKKISSSAKIIVFGATNKHTPFEELLKPCPEEESFRPVPAKAPTDTAMIFFTSGSTGVPKPICHNHVSMLHQFNNLINTRFGWEVSLEYTSPFWTVFSAFFGPTTMLGNTRLIYREFDPSIAWDFTRYKTSVMFLSVTEALLMCRDGRPKDVSLHYLKYILIAGNFLSESQLRNLESLFPGAHIIYAYGQSEVPGALAMFKPAFDQERVWKSAKIKSVGTGFSGISYKIVDDDEVALGPNQQGELRVKTDYSLGGLHHTDSAQLFDSDGWLKTGDLAYYDEDRCFYIVGRLKDMFKYQCFRIIPSTIQNVILTHPAVADAVVFGIPHEIDGEHPMALVTLNKCKTVSANDIERYVKERVHDSHRLRAGVKIVDAFIKTSSGKVKKNVMRELVIQVNFCLDFDLFTQVLTNNCTDYLQPVQLRILVIPSGIFGNKIQNLDLDQTKIKISVAPPVKEPKICFDFAQKSVYPIMLLSM